MIIGLDLDNTIIDYRNAFWETALETGILIESDRDFVTKNRDTIPNKKQIKNYFSICKKDFFSWEALQGQVYGKYIHYAKLFPGIGNFLLHAKRRKNQIFILSHKTEYGHHDESFTNLRKAALSFLQNNSLLNGKYGITKKNIFFFNTRKEKIDKIAELNCGYFVDDLQEVLEDKIFPKKTTKIHFDIHSEKSSSGIFNSWEKISNEIFGEIEEEDITFYIENLSKKTVKKVDRIKGRSNSRVYKIELDTGQKLVGKLYPEKTFDERFRLEKETKAYKFLHSKKIKLTPKSIWYEKKLNFALFEWIDGREIKKISDEQINQAAEFIRLLTNISKNVNYSDFKLASAACISGQMIEQQIIHRFKNISNLTYKNSELNSFLDNDFYFTFKKILLSSKQLWPGDFARNLSINYQILSPSDFGFHNVLNTKNGLRFLDFEYFGWDDPAKLISDFLLHPGMVLNDNQKSLWLNRMENIFVEDKTFRQRLTASYCLYGLCWILIILNIFFREKISQKNKGIKEGSFTKTLDNHISQSKKLLLHLKEVQNFGLKYE